VGAWRGLHYETLHNFIASSNAIRVIRSWKMRGAEHVARVVEMRYAYNNLVGRMDEKRPLGRPKRRWECN